MKMTAKVIKALPEGLKKARGKNDKPFPAAVNTQRIIDTTTARIRCRAGHIHKNRHSLYGMSEERVL
jgi:hypothetical protein